MKKYCITLLVIGVIGCVQTKKPVYMPTSGHSFIKDSVLSITPEDLIFPELLKSCQKFSNYAANTSGFHRLGGTYVFYSDPLAGTFRLNIEQGFSRQCLVGFDSDACNKSFVTFTVRTTVETFKEVTAREIAKHIIEASDFLPEKNASP